MEGGQKGSRARAIWEIGSTVAMLAIGAAIAWQNWGRPAGASPPQRPGLTMEIPSQPIQLGEHLMGNQTAPVAVVVFSDFECPFCAKFAQDVAPTLQREFVATGKVLLAFRHFPLPNHSRAAPAARAAWCAGRQGRFWEMHDILFSPRGGLEDNALSAAARDLALDVKAYDLCFAGAAASEAVSADKAEADLLRIPVTPAFLIGRVSGGRVAVSDTIAGAQPIEVFREKLVKILGR
jgi:protein-disulfide isomerase